MDNNYNAFQAVMKSFAFMWVLTALGMLVGTFLPPGIVVVANVITIILLIITIFVRSVKFHKFVAYAVPFFVGITLFWSTQFYLDVLGKSTVLLVFAGTVVTFILLGIFGSLIKRDLSGMGKYLFGALLVVIVMSIIFVFVSVSNLMYLILAGGILLIFVLYTIYDFNMIKNNPPAAEDVPMVALDLYLDFINLFRAILEVVWRIKEEYLD